MNVDEVWQNGISFAELVQAYEEKSLATAKAPSRSFYPLYLCLLKVSDEMQRKLIVTGFTIVAYLL